MRVMKGIIMIRREVVVVVGGNVFKLVEAQDPSDKDIDPSSSLNETGAEMVQELRKSPAENWEKFLQPIIINIRSMYGLEIGQVSLVGPRIQTKFTTPRYGFSIVGHVKFIPEPPDNVIKNHGTPPYAFEAAVTPNGELISSVDIKGSEG